MCSDAISDDGPAETAGSHARPRSPARPTRSARDTVTSFRFRLRDSSIHPSAALATGIATEIATEIEIGIRIRFRIHTRI
jgi:hypothetical protein